METAAMGGRTGTHERLWTWQQHDEEGGGIGAHGRLGAWQQLWEARRYIGAHGRLGAWQQLWEARNLPAPYVKKFNTTSSVRRPESGTWQSVSNGRPYRDP
ncbi:unnamed protein product [Staurois parvus]|uniref:Uncharacterized protein n=1 Tax=Staurois parvus TaxID=386267 RepID=A0ABN9E234_9NEOB|nr:unnamed protein product [Staurois parvus]